MFGQNESGAYLVALTRQDVRVLEELGSHTFELPGLGASFTLVFKETSDELMKYLGRGEPGGPVFHFGANE
jgi:hypothetical protein